MPRKKPKKKPEGLKTKLQRLLASEPSQEDLPARVQLNVGGDASINEMILTGLKKELSSLEGVIVTDDNPRYRIFVTGMDTPEPIVAVVITDALGMESGSPYGTVLKTILTGSLNEDEMDAAEKIVSEHDHIFSMWLIRAPSGDVLQLCEETANRFYEGVLEPDRRKVSGR